VAVAAASAQQVVGTLGGASIRAARPESISEVGTV